MIAVAFFAYDQYYFLATVHLLCRQFPVLHVRFHCTYNSYSSRYQTKKAVGTRQAIHHGFASRDNSKQLAAIHLTFVLLLTRMVRSDLKAYSSRILLHYPIHRLLRFNKN
jgi:hypothetical protein